MSEDGETLAEIYEAISKRRKTRDNFYLRHGKMISSRELGFYWKNWIAEEIKDLLILTSQFQNSTNMVLRDTAADINRKVTVTDKKFTRIIIQPLNKFSNGSVRAKSEMEHMEKFEKAIMTACKLVKELGVLRDTLDDALESSHSDVQRRDYRFYG